MFSTAIYVIGLCMAFLYVFFGLDDLLWDLANFISKLFRRRESKLPIDKLDLVPPKLLAVMVAAWHEENVLEPVVDNMIASIHYPRSMYHVFLGVYPNDGATVDVARRLEEKHPNVHVVVNTRPGPTCKADNVNSIIRAVRRFEEQRGWRFASVTVHDSEDVVHPYELKVTNFLIDSFDALQFPVFPLMIMPTWKNFFRNITTGTYADEFAEHHYRTMGMRDGMAAVVPSAGTGFVISHRILDAYRGRELFPEGSLTEDYKLSLTFAQLGYRVHYVLEKVLRITSAGKVKWDFIATRSIFPSTFRTAVRQKTRWTFGITMQSVKFRDIFAPGKMTLAGRYTVYKDLKSKYSNLVILPGYLVLAYNILSYIWTSLPNMYPNESFSWWLTFFLMSILLFRQFLRGIAIWKVYGMKSVFFSCLLPPVLPIRLVWSNIINLSATLRAWRQLLFGVKNSPSRKKPVWNKTDHEFLEKQVLFRFYRNLGDVLLEKGAVTPEIMKHVLGFSRSQELKISDILAYHGLVTDRQLADAVAASKHVPYISSLAYFSVELLMDFDAARLWEVSCCPILKTPPGGLVWAATVRTPESFCDVITAAGGEIVYTTEQEVSNFLVRPLSDARSAEAETVDRLLNAGSINWEQACLALDLLPRYAAILRYTGLLAEPHPTAQTAGSAYRSPDAGRIMSTCAG